ncbi:myb domain-containing protein [Heterostelium album PN500]|uniref:Myb domain-containing protein n=1 Tax=Heterostelium pallidum (strain ATCC 26659 / Pp 5 / PN500) TaxID=670386 RepID=D3B6L9_HETP5|nr:myb domain-containing protein [Heterostelium album PN500]EFA82989.1 myb domain-containing protein [Heterostelium album PN500]|eukprot:XP_020435106.1 myb domain-containing protein [Heterostelium album PN500]
MDLVVSVGSPSTEYWKEGDQVREFYYSSLGGWPCIRSVDPVGKGFEFVWKKLQRKEHDTGVYEDINQADDDEDEEDNVSDEHFNALKEKYKNKSKDWLKDIDHYEIMGLGHLRWRATENDIKVAYKKMILICHPDKNEGGSDEAFKTLQKAYDVLGDPKKRRTYDSKEPFDDTLPSSYEADRGDFFKVFEPVFEMNSRWSSIQPAPKIGNMETPYEKVLKFYDFWWGFKSWRDFSFDDDYDLEQAESRDEKRWMEKQNEKKRSKLRKDESSRILELANMAYKRDPRILKKQRDEEQARQQAKQAKIDAKLKAQEEKERAELEEKQRREAEEKRLKEEELEKKNKKKEETKIINRAKNGFRKLCYGPPEPLYMPSPPTIEEVEFICGELSHLELVEYTQELSAMAAETEKKRQSFKSKFEALQSDKKERERIANDSKKAKQEEIQNDRLWTDDELSQLAKAIQKFPAGCQNRWESIATMVPTRSLKEVINKAKEAQPTKAFAKPAVQTTSAYEKFKSKVGEKPIASDLTSRQEIDPTAPAAVALKVAKEAAPSKESSTTTTTSTTATSTPAAPSKESSTPKEDKKKEEQWSVDEQKLLEEGLQKFDKSLGDRWDQIAKNVGTKSKKECVARYKYLVALYKSK